MQGKTEERWQVLCEQAATEQDPDRLMELIREVDHLLHEQQTRLTQQYRSHETRADLSDARD